ncbi:biliverdin-producing heme oxygenase [Algoriphagus sp. Y33]|uniref:biliverdin-producing heme oxygenase n=1 Tax=Algoriphagus sp. Y33 TaxID=2772483 RepID=UPI00177EC558|nr:biliverdin-producing heme oxygenase [Algoriphagus sp. Y33]
MSLAISSPSFAQKLKQNTSHLHRELENLPISKSILKAEVTTKDYLKYLDLMCDVINDVETEIFPLVKHVVKDLDKRRKRHLITQDLRALGFDKSTHAKVLKDLKMEIPTGFAMGILYVIEGSTIGGKIISKHIQKTLGYSSEMGATYFAGYGEFTGLFWKNFLIELLAYEKTHNNGNEIIEGANYTFAIIKTHFTISKGR